MRPCSKCGLDQPDSVFQHFNGRPAGQCRACKTEAMKAHRLKLGTPVKNSSVLRGLTKKCTGCKAFRPMGEFSPTERGLGGVATQCKACAAAAARGRKPEGRAYTATYRARHRARHLANHRVRMFERRNRVRVQSDGTATDEFLAGLYATTQCHYCQKDTPPTLRTADHRECLALGGKHSASNLVMACWSCNSSKRDLTEKDFVERRKHDRN